MTTLSFKVTDREAQDIRRRARQERVSVSEYLRRRAALPASSKGEIRVGRCSLTGAPVFDAGELDLPPLTVESTRNMLADFP